MDSVDQAVFQNETNDSSGGNSGIHNTLDTKKISELKAIRKIKGTELVLIEDVESEGDTLKTTVDDLLGYIANRINAGDIPSSQLYSNSIHVIPLDEEYPIEQREEGDIYLQVVENTYIPATANTPSQIRVGPNMGLKILDKGGYE